MSRSYRKPWVVDGWKGSRHKQFMKRDANSRIRKMKDIPNGGAYRKFTDQYSICDYKWLVSKPNPDEPDEWEREWDAKEWARVRRK